MQGELLHRLSRYSILLWMVMLGVMPVQAISSSIAISMVDQEAPADDLIDHNQKIDQGQAIDLMQQGIDLSALDPVPNSVWNGGRALSVQNELELYPPEGALVQYSSKLTTSKNIFRSRVVFAGNAGSQFYQMSAALSSHAALARNALLRKLGYAIPAPRYYRRLIVRFKNRAEREVFLNTISDSTFTATSRWVVPGESGAADDQLILQDMVLESSQMNVPTYHWGELPVTHVKAQRALRALIVPLILMDLTESANLFSYELGKIMNRSVFLTYSSASSFQTTTYPDARWIARKIAALSRADLEEIVTAATLPSDVTALLVEKVVARRNHMVQLFDLAGELSTANQIFPVQQNLSVGSVIRGKLMRAKYDGYAARFSYGDPLSPLRSDEVGRYVFLNTIGAGLSALTTTLNKYLQINSMSDVLAQYQTDAMRSAIGWMVAHPNQPYVQTAQLWGGPIAGFGVQANRSVIVGSFYGTNVKVQLVDSIGVSASVGVYAGIDGVKPLIPNFTGNLTVQRNYVHVRPIADMKSVIHGDWSQLVVPKFMNHLTDLLEDPKPGMTQTVEEKYAQFLDTLKEGEILMITDSTSLGAKGQINIPIPVLMDPTVAIFNPSVGMSAGSFPTIFRRTMITRTADGIQVYLQNAKAMNAELELNFNWWMNLGRLYHENRLAVADTRAYLLDQGSSTKKIDQLMLSLRTLIRSNDPEVLAENFKNYQLHHNLELQVDRAKFLWLQAYGLQEEHRVRVAPPDDPSAFRTLFSSRQVSNFGMNLYAFLGDIISTTSKGVVNLPSNGVWNPASSPFGSAQWVSVSTEAEVPQDFVSEAGASKPVSLVDSHFSGWLLTRDGLNRILDRLEQKAKALNLGRPLIRREEFSTADHLELYDINSTLIIYPAGVDRIIRDLFLPSMTASLQRLIEIEGKENLRRWCDEGERHAFNFVTANHSYSFRENGRTMNYRCLKPWMQELLDLRVGAQASRSGGFFLTAENRVRWQNQLIRIASDHMEFEKFLNWIGQESYFYQIRVSGFRSKDENGDTDYVSDSIGSYRPEEGSGPFHEFITKIGLMGFELYGRYLAEAYQGQ